MAEELRELRLSKQIPAKDMVAVVQAIYPKYKKDAHRLTCRISARLETADYEALQRLIEAEGYATTQDWLTATVRRYIAEAGETE